MMSPEKIKDILMLDIINNTPIAVALYPDLEPNSARAKLHHKLHYDQKLEPFECIIITEVLNDLKEKL